MYKQIKTIAFKGIRVPYLTLTFEEEKEEEFCYFAFVNKA